MSAADKLNKASELLNGVRGGIALSMEARKPIKRAVIADWIDRLRRAADKLEELIK